MLTFLYNENIWRHQNIVKSGHLHLYSAFNNVDSSKTALQ